MSDAKWKGLKRYKSPTGVWYSYHRPSGVRIEPPHVFGTLEFEAAYRAAEEAHSRARKEGYQKPKAATFGDLIRLYHASPAFERLRDRTRFDYTRVLSWLGTFMDDAPIGSIDPPSVVKVRDHALKTRKRRFANYVLSVMSVVFAHAIENGAAKQNPVKGVKTVRRGDELPIPNRAWSEAEKLAVLAEAPPHLGLPIAIARWTGLRRGDVVALKRTAYRDGVITLQTSKRGVPLKIPVVSQLRTLLDAQPPGNSVKLLANSRGRPWTGNGFAASFRKLIAKLEREGMVQPGLTFHGLRTSLAQELRELGYGERDIADALGQKDTKSGAYYSRNADREIALRRVFADLERTDDEHALSRGVSRVSK